MNLDLIYTLILVALICFLSVAYFFRIQHRGRAHFDRIDRQGGSKLLSKNLMEMGYWGMQPFARLLVFFGVTPNQISWASLTFGLIAGICLAFGHFGSGAAISVIACVLDALDGMVARITEKSSQAGEVLDCAMDRHVEFFFLAGLTIYYREILILQILSLLALLGSFMVSYSSIMGRAERVETCPTRGSMRRPERVFYLVLGAALSPVTITWFEKVREYPIAIGHPMVLSLALVAVFANFSAFEQFTQIIRGIQHREKDQKKTRYFAAEVVDFEDVSAYERTFDSATHSPKTRN